MSTPTDSALLDVVDRLAELWAEALPEAQVITGSAAAATGGTKDVIVTVGAAISFTLAEAPMGTPWAFDMAADIACTIELTMPGATEQRRAMVVAFGQVDERLGIDRVMWVRMLGSGSLRSLTDRATLEKGRGVALPFTVRVQVEGF